MNIEYKVNAKVEVFTIDNKKIGNCKIQDEGPESIFISYPSGGQSEGLIRRNEPLKFVYISETNKIFDFESEVIGLVKNDSIPLLEIRKPSEFEIIQRRNTVRINVMLDVELYIVPDEVNIFSITDNELNIIMKDFKKIKAYSFDLSAGGIGIIHMDRQIEGTKVIVFIKDDYFKEGFRGKIVRVIENKKAGKKLYKMGIQFLDLNYRKEEGLVRFIFGKMRESLKTR